MLRYHTLIGLFILGMNGLTTLSPEPHRGQEKKDLKKGTIIVEMIGFDTVITLPPGLKHEVVASKNVKTKQEVVVKSNGQLLIRNKPPAVIIQGGDTLTVMAAGFITDQYVIIGKPEGYDVEKKNIPEKMKKKEESLEKKMGMEKKN